MVAVRRSAISLTSVVALIIASAPGAWAHTVSNSAYPYRSAADCHYGESLIDHGTQNRGFSYNLRRSLQGGSASQCSAQFLRPAGSLRISTVVEKQLPNQTWATCFESSVAYNGGQAWELAQAYQGFVTACGAGNYRVRARGAHYFQGEWRGGAVFSGQHYLNASQPV